MKYFIIAGEASGDLHGSNLVKELKALDPKADIQGWGGDKMQAAGVEVQKHIRELAFMGFVEVLMNIGKILKNFSLCKKQILHFHPDVIICVDYPGFNLRMAKWGKIKGFKIAYYISPTVWAWKENRVETVRQYVDRMICILPFEKDFYATKNVSVDYVGHPTVDVIEYEKSVASSIEGNNLIALLPGSRKQEIDKMLPIMLEATKTLTECRLVIAQAPNLDRDVYQPYLKDHRIELVQHKTYDILKVAKAAIVTSGTATLETALFGVPQVVCYIANGISYAIAKRLVKVDYISLVNLILHRESVLELIQHDMTVENVKTELEKLLYDATRKDQLRNDYAELSDILRQGGASKKTAVIIHNLLLENRSKNHEQDRKQEH
jgi:lipid-A-disaccharide synthase